MRSASAGRSATITPCLRAAARSANSRSSVASNARGSASAAARRLLERARRLLETDERPVERGDRLVEQTAGLRRLPFEPADEARKGWRRARGPGHGLVSLGDVARDLLGTHEQLPAVGERVLLVGLRCERAKLLDRGAEVLALRPRGVDPPAELRRRAFRLAPFPVRQCDRGSIRVEAAEGVEESAMDVGIDHGAVVVLSVDLDQRRAELREAA